jgi:AcrR family transcriptional regulator
MKAEDRRRQLVRAAIDSFARHGFGGTRTKDIARAAGVSEGILFQHFATKEDLYRAILDSKDDKDTAERLMLQLASCARSRDDAGLFRHLAEHVIRSFREDPAFHRLMLFALLEGHVVAELFRERFGSRVTAFMRRYVALRQKEGAFRNREPKMAVTFAVGTIVHFAMGKYAFGLKGLAGDGSVLEEIVAFVLGGLGTDDSHAGRNAGRAHARSRAGLSYDKKM